MSLTAAIVTLPGCFNYGNLLQKCAVQVLLRTASAFEGLANDSSDTVRGPIWEGVVECYQQTLWFTILRPGFREAMRTSEAAYVQSLMDEPVYQRAFELADADGPKQRLQRFLFRHRLARLTVACFRTNGLLFEAKKRFGKFGVK